MKFKKQYKIELAKTLQGHFYDVYLNGKKVDTVPSSTTILQAYPTSEHLVKWIAENGFHESRQLRDKAGIAGSKIHSAIEALLKGGVIYERDYTLEEYNKLYTFTSWYNDVKPEIVELEMPVYSPKHHYAGRLDCIVKIDGKYGVLDWKSSKNLHDSFPLQFSSYAQAIEEITDIKIDFTAVLQLGANNKKGYRYVIYNDWKDDFKVFLSVKKTWEYDQSKISEDGPKIIIVPESLRLDIIPPLTEEEEVELTLQKRIEEAEQGDKND